MNPQIKVPMDAISPYLKPKKLDLLIFPILPNQNPHNIKPGIWVNKSLLIESKTRPIIKPVIVVFIGPFTMAQGNNQNIGQ